MGMSCPGWVEGVGMWCLQSWLGHPSLHPLLPRLGCCAWHFQVYIKVLSGCQGVNDPPQMPVPQGELRGVPLFSAGKCPMGTPGSGEAVRTGLSQDLAHWEELVGELGRCVRCTV